MQSIVILTPLGLEKELFNLVEPIAKQYECDINSAHMLGCTLKQLKEYSDKSNLFNTLAASRLAELLFLKDKLIWIGPCCNDHEVKHIFAYYPDMVEAQESCIKSYGLEYDKLYYTVSDATEKFDDTALLIRRIKEILDGTK